MFLAGVNQMDVPLYPHVVVVDVRCPCSILKGLVDSLIPP